MSHEHMYNCDFLICDKLNTGTIRCNTLKDFLFNTGTFRCNIHMYLLSVNESPTYYVCTNNFICGKLDHDRYSTLNKIILHCVFFSLESARIRGLVTRKIVLSEVVITSRKLNETQKHRRRLSKAGKSYLSYAYVSLSYSHWEHASILSLFSFCVIARFGLAASGGGRQREEQTCSHQENILVLTGFAGFYL
jgi:hypothetical protein